MRPDKLGIAALITEKPCCEMGDKIHVIENGFPSKTPLTASQAKAVDDRFIIEKADYDAKQYQRDRRPEYGSWEDQLDMMYHGTWEAHVQAVKEKYPK